MTGETIADAVGTRSIASRWPAAGSLAGPDAVALLMADVHDGVGPCLSAFPLPTRRRQAGAIGIAMSASAIAAFALLFVPLPMRGTGEDRAAAPGPAATGV